jgi:hypothetical protein
MDEGLSGVTSFNARKAEAEWLYQLTLLKAFFSKHHQVFGISHLRTSDPF